METSLKDFRADYLYFGYGYFNSVDEAIPPVGLTFTTFRLMVILGSYFLLFYIFTIALTYKPQLLERWRWFQLTAMISVPFMWVCSEAGWAVAEVGRQPWTIQDLLPTCAAISDIPASSVVTTFWMFAAVFTAFLAAEICIMTRQLRKGAETDFENEK